MLPPISQLQARLSHPGAHQALIESLLTQCQAPQADHVFIELWADQALAAARAADDAAAAGRPQGALAGLPLSIKSLFDVAGRRTLAGSVLRRDAPLSTADAPAVARLRQAGAALMGHTNMTEFAFSGVGLNPHYGTPRNPADAALARIPGGSSSGAAVSVALGLAVAGLGSDTGGSIRIPAALCGLVGFKSTQSRTPLVGAFPLSTTLDTVCAMTCCVGDALIVDAVLASAPLAVPPRGADALRGLLLALPQTLLLQSLEPAVALAFERALSTLSAAGAQIVELPLTELAEIAQINAPAGIAAIEAFALHRDDLRHRADQFDPRVAARIALGEPVSAADYIVLLQRRRDWIARVTRRLAGFDALICPTVPMLAPPLAPLQASDELFYKTNALLLRNPSVVNFLDGCAFTLPCQAAGELPTGLMLSAPGGHDAALAGVALAVEAALRAQGLGLGRDAA